MAIEVQRFSLSDSKLEHGNWRIPKDLRLKPLKDPEDDDFLVNHKIDRSYDDSTVNFKLVVGSAVSANLKDQDNIPIDPKIRGIIKKQGWMSDEYEHLWRRDGGGSAALTSHGILTFLLQTPRDGKSFCSLSLVNRERSHCGGVFITDEEYSLQRLLAEQPYLNKHPKVPRDFAILPFNVLVHHIEETETHVQKLTRDITSSEKRISQGEIQLEDNVDYKLLNRYSLEHLRLQRRSNFEVELAGNLMKYIDEYHRMWTALWEGGTSYIEEMREKIEQQERYADQVKLDLEVIPRRIKQQSKTIFNFIAQKDNAINIELAKSSRKIAEESRKDNLLNLEIAKSTAQVAEETRQDSAAMKTIAIMTLIFLPGTAIASFFSMQMFNWYPNHDQPIASPFLYIYFVVTVPVTGFVWVIWYWWFKLSQKQYQKRHEDGLQDVEKKLRLAARTVTGTW